MADQLRIPFESLSTTPLTVDAVYEGGSSGTAADDPLARLLPVGNQGGFRISGKRSAHNYRVAALYTSLADADWPDSLDRETGLLTYFGDNKSPGAALHATARRGNEMLRYAFDKIHSDPPARHSVPPFFVFQKATPGSGRDIIFLGVAVPGGSDVSSLDDLVAVWRTTAGQRFQNYRAVFTILDIPVVSREWITELAAGAASGQHAPDAFADWVGSGTYRPLLAPRTAYFRTRAEQMPTSPEDVALVRTIYEHFKPNPTRFEACAIELWKMASREPVSILATRPTRDGGRDAYGTLSIGPPVDPVHLDFSLEAKCYALDHGCGVREISRLISRLRHRQFGVFVTTSYVGAQPYQEIREDGHPVIILAAHDIVDLLKQQGKATVAVVEDWLSSSFPQQ